MNILVTGVTGLVGHLVARQLMKEGHTVRVMIRNTRLLAQMSKYFSQTINADLTNPESLKKAVEGIDAVIHCAGLVGSGRASDDFYMRINGEGTQFLAEAAHAAGVKRFVFTSTVGVYGTNTMKPNIDESTPYSKANGYTNSKIAAEQAIFTTGIPYTILRPYWITGESDRFLIPQVARLIENNAFFYIGNGEQEWSLSVIENVTDAIAVAATHTAAKNQIYNLSDTRIKIRETISEIAGALDLPVPTHKISVLSAWMRFLLNNNEKSPGHINIDLFFPLWRGVTINSEKIRRELGWQPKTDWRESIRRGAKIWKQERHT